MRYTKVLVAVILILLCSCSSAKGAKVPPVTDGLNCIVRAKGENVEQVLSIKRNGETYEAIFQHDDGSRGMGMTVSPNGCAIEIFGLLKRIDFDYLANSIPGLIYTALHHDYSPDQYNDGVYTSTDICGEYTVSISDNGMISSINFSDLNYLCYFDYHAA